jgi:hypothetical protein
MTWLVAMEWCSERVSSSCSTSDTRCVNLVTNPVETHEWGKVREVFTTSGTYPWSFVMMATVKFSLWLQLYQKEPTGATSGGGTAYPSEAPEFTSGFSGVRVTRSLVLYVCFVDRCFSFCIFSFGHCVVCSSIYGFWLPLWYLQTLLESYLIKNNL